MATKVLGIIGGMGPAATVDLYDKLLRYTDAACDQAHVPVLIDGNTRIPDRTAAILHGGEDPRPELCKSAKRLENAGAELLMMACNTAHYFYDDVCAAVRVPVLHMPRITAAAAREKGYARVALLATSGTVQSGVYADAFSREAPNIELLLPEDEEQTAIMSLIYDGVKAGHKDLDVTPVRKLLERMTRQGAACFILGCTELPLAFSMYALDAPTLDPTSLLAKEALRQSGARLRIE
ncbi:MAG: amino acid racemase [Clostridia bacterium]|nr:amino acid racemase [Clostridia bacterium]